MKIKLAVRPKVEVNGPFYDPTSTDICAKSFRLRNKQWALRWLGEKYLLAHPLNQRRSKHEQP
jgi:hypothetical protein